jgi:hypothetical protein
MVIFFYGNAKKNNFKIYDIDLNLLYNYATTVAARDKLV